MEVHASTLQEPVADGSRSASENDTQTPSASHFRQWRTQQRRQGAEVETRSIKRILVPTDFSPTSLRAVDFAAALAYQWGAVLTVLHVIDVNSECAAGAAEDLMGTLWEKAFEQMQHLASSLGEKVNSQTVIEEGLPWEQIIEKSGQADLVIFGKRDCKPIWNPFSKRTAQAVIENARCPVMLFCPGSS
jgi:nucleotide-binding universal stress UspA family protein